jgi:RimJ/RimL family protein N-acetyltransferase
MLQPLENENIPSLFKLFHQDETVRYLDLPAASWSSFNRFMNEILANEFLGFCVPRTIWCNGQIAGMIMLTNITYEEGMAEMGTWLGADFRGKGLNAAAKEQMLDFAFSDLNLETVLLITTADNFRSKKALSKLPYVQLNNQCYLRLKKQRDFLFRSPHDIYEIKRVDYLERIKS